jgi:hypothetical protein
MYDSHITVHFLLFQKGKLLHVIGAGYYWLNESIPRAIYEKPSGFVKKLTILYTEIFYEKLPGQAEAKSVVSRCFWLSML